MKAWLVHPNSTIEEISIVPEDDHILIRVSDKYFNGDIVTLTRVIVNRLPEAIRQHIKDSTTHFSVDDSGLPKGLDTNPLMSYAYGTSRIVGLAVVYEKELE